MAHDKAPSVVTQPAAGPRKAAGRTTDRPPLASSASALDDGARADSGQPAPEPQGEEFHFMGYVFDIDRARLIVGSRQANEYVDPRPLAAEAGMWGVDRDRAMTVSLDEPGIVGTIPSPGNPQEYLRILIDGWHRATRAGTEGLDRLKVHILTLEETASIMSGQGPRRPRRGRR